jgi:hypothetical protein
MIMGKQLRSVRPDLRLLSLIAAVCLVAGVPGSLALAQSSESDSPTDVTTRTPESDSSSTANQSTTQSGSGRGVYMATIDLMGALTLSAQFTSDPGLTSCADLGKGGTPFILSVSNLPAGGHSLYVLVEHPNLPTPAAGGSINFQNVGSNFGIDGDIYVTAMNDSLTVNSDGSGSFIFSGAENDSNPPQMLSGKLYWTCSG